MAENYETTKIQPIVDYKLGKITINNHISTLIFFFLIILIFWLNF